jgi:flagellin
MAVADFSRINSNIGALNSLNSLQNVNKQLGMHQLRLATGRRINSAEDDPAGLTIATKFRSRNENLKTAIDNIGQGKNMLSVAESGLNKIQDILVTMRKKAEEAANDTLGADERTAIGEQLAQFANEIDDIVGETTWNGKKLLDGLNQYSGTIHLQTGAESSNQTTLKQADFDDVSVKDGGLTGLATYTASDTIGTLTDTAYNVLNDGTGPAAAGNKNANLSVLKSDTYTIRVNYGGTLGDDSTVELLDSQGNALMVDADGAVASDGDNEAVDVKVSGLDLSGVGTTAINFGNGLTVTLNNLTDATPAANGSYVATVGFTAGGSYTVDVGDETKARNYMDSVDTAIGDISGRLQTLGALTSRLTIKEENLAGAQINTEAAYNRIMNADMAMSQLEATKFQILQQTATTMLAQANQAPQGLLSLFR